MTVPYKTIVTLLQNGQPVDAPTTNVPIGDLTQRTDALKAILDALEAGRVLRVDGVTLEPGLLIGSPVYLDTDNVFKAAATALDNTSVGGAVASSSYVYGVIVAKDTDTVGSLVLGGVATLDTAVWAAVMDGGFAAGHYWLSAVNPGKISLLPGPLAVYVGQAKADGSFLVKISGPAYGAHVHEHFVLRGDPAGTVVDPSVAAPQSVNFPDAAVRGWLPASAPYFDVSHIPAGAKFGYNFAPTAENALRAAFPPVPLDGVTFDQGDVLLPDTLVTVNEFGIWWMDNTYGNAPWPVDYAATGIAPVVDFWFSRLLFATANSIVTRLEKHPGSVLDIEILDVSDQPATAGNLKLRVTTVLNETSAVDEGELAVKSVTGGDMTRGPAVARVVPGPGITISSGHGDPVAGFYGTCIVSASASAALQGVAEIVNLGNAREDSISDVQVCTLPVGRTSAPVFTMSVSALAPTTSKMKLKFWVFSDKSGTVPAGVTVEYRIVPAPATNTALPTGWTSLLTLAGTTLVAGQSAQFDASANIPNVPSGALVLVRINRANGDAFSGNVSIVRLGFALVP